MLRKDALDKGWPCHIPTQMAEYAFAKTSSDSRKSMSAQATGEHQLLPSIPKMKIDALLFGNMNRRLHLPIDHAVRRANVDELEIANQCLEFFQ